MSLICRKHTTGSVIWSCLIDYKAVHFHLCRSFCWVKLDKSWHVYLSLLSFIMWRWERTASWYDHVLREICYDQLSWAGFNAYAADILLELVSGTLCAWFRLKLCSQDLAAVREGQDSLHIHVFRGQRGSDGALGRRGQQDTGAHGTHDEGLLAGTQLIILLFIHIRSS